MKIHFEKIDARETYGGNVRFPAPYHETGLPHDSRSFQFSPFVQTCIDIAALVFGCLLACVAATAVGMAFWFALLFVRF